MLYIVPEYYKNFTCKCGECRHSCCDRWPIRISTKEYFYLIGVECSLKLRTRLDCALKLNHEAGNSSSAQIATDWQGNCMMHREDGFCALQAELGENSLPEVCRLYPRNTKHFDEGYKCSCSNSCEKVVELLMNMEEPLCFEMVDLTLKPEFVLRLPPEKQELCNTAISIMQDRRHSLPERFITLRNLLFGTDSLSIKSGNLYQAYQLLRSFDHYFESSVSISDYCTEVLNYYKIKGNDLLSEEEFVQMSEKHRSASEHLNTILPDWECLFEQLIVNHMYYNDFPYIDGQDKVSEAFMSLIMTYSFLRFNILGSMAGKTSTEVLVDIIASMFRVIEHSNFRDVAERLLHMNHYTDPEVILQLLQI